MRSAVQPTVVADRYTLLTRLRNDRASVTWLANDVVLDRRVVLELVRPETALDPGVVAAIDSATRALARTATEVLLGVLDAGVDDGSPFLVTEHVAGTTFEDLLREGGPIDPDAAVDVGMRVLGALAETHVAGIVHLDVRPATVVRATDGIRVCAPGSAQALIRARRTAELEDERALPPEAFGDRVDERSDVWCAGALLFELLTGRRPAPAARFVRAERRDVSRALDAVIARALAPDPIDRHPDIAAMREALERARVTPAQHEGELNDGARTRRGVFRTWLAVPLLVAVIGLAVVGGGVWLGRLEVGGPVGIRLPDEGQPATTSASAVLDIAAVSAYDPLGDGAENSHNVALVADGDRTSVWRSENYFDGELHKEGVGLLIDLGGSVDVGSVRVWTPSPGFSFSVRVGDDPEALVDDVAAETRAGDETRVQVGDANGRYVLIWATSVVPTADGNRVEIAEVRVLGPTE